MICLCISNALCVLSRIGSLLFEAEQGLETSINLTVKNLCIFRIAHPKFYSQLYNWITFNGLDSLLKHYSSLQVLKSIHLGFVF